MPGISNSLKPVAAAKTPSGNDKVRKRKKIEAENAKLSAAAKKHFCVQKPETTTSETKTTQENDYSTASSSNPGQDSEDTSTNANTENLIGFLAQQEAAEDFSVDHADPSTWSVPMPSSLRKLLLMKGPKSTVLKNYTSRGGFTFNNKHFHREEVNHARNWLLYSKSTNSLFCYVCCLFSESSQKSTSSPWSNYGLQNEGFCDFRHLSRGIKMHEESHSHFSSFLSWRTYEKNLKKNSLINSKLEANFRKEAKFWEEVLAAILDAILFLAKNNLAFLGSSKNINEKDCGNFLSLIKLLSKYYPPLALHTSRLSKGKVSYLSSNIQNEFISIAGAAVRKNIIQDIISRKYYVRR